MREVVRLEHVYAGSPRTVLGLHGGRKMAECSNGCEASRFPPNPPCPDRADRLSPRGRVKSVALLARP